MKIQNTPNLQTRLNNQDQRSKNTSNVAFGGGEAIANVLNFVQTNQAVGASLVDIGFMCTPRTVVDFTRSTDAGIETGRREYSSNINNALIGAYGVGAATLLSHKFNKDYQVAGNKMFVDENSLDIMTHVRNEKGDFSEKSENLKAYLEDILDNTKGYNPIVNTKNGGHSEINSGDKDKFVKKFIEEFGPESTGEKSKDSIKETKSYLKSLIVHSTGSESQIKLARKIKGKEEAVVAELSADDFVDNLYTATKSFMSKKVIDESGKIKPEFIKKLKGIHAGSTILGLGTSAAIAMSVQPVNMYLTKKKTGNDGFVGVEGRERDKSSGFKFLKMGFAGVAAFGILASTVKSPKIFPKEILKAVKFKGFVPTLNQFKLVYGATVVSRILSARDKNELRETSIKDSLGFANWLILGGFASNLAALGFEKLSKFKNNNIKFFKESENVSKKPKWLSGSIESRTEALHAAFKNAGIDVFADGVKNMSFKEKLKTFNKIASEADKSALKTKVKYLGFIQFAGYLWSGLALGIGVPKLNITITNAVEKKNKAQKASEAPVNEESTQATA